MLPCEWQVLLTGKDGFVPVLPHQPRDVILLGIHKVHGDFLQEGHMGMSSYSKALPKTSCEDLNFSPRANLSALNYYMIIQAGERVQWAKSICRQET